MGPKILVHGTLLPLTPPPHIKRYTAKESALDVCTFESLSQRKEAKLLRRLPTEVMLREWQVRVNCRNKLDSEEMMMVLRGESSEHCAIKRTRKAYLI